MIKKQFIWTRKLPMLKKALAKINVQAGVLKWEFAKRSGKSQTPGFSIYSYYHEFFADLFAAVYHSDPNVIGDSFVSIFGPTYSDTAMLVVLRRWTQVHLILING